MKRALRFAASLADPRSYLQALRLLNYYNYSHARERVKISMGKGVRFSPNVSIRNGQRVSIGAHAHIGERCSLWAGDSSGQITIGEYALFGPEVYITASNYGVEAGTPVMQQEKAEQDVHVGRDVWLGARVIVLPGVTIGDGCVVGAGSVVTRDLEPGSIAVGVPAKVVKRRE